jgi:TRAP-type C4-dicarboxylate transport system substrate-binding protein
MTMKKIMALWLSSLLFICLFACGPEKEETIKLTYSVFFPPTHGHSIAAEDMAKAIAKRTKDRVQIEVYAGGTLTKPQVAYDGVVQGISDLAMSAFAYTRGRFPVMEAIDLPFGYPDGLVASRVAWEFCKQMDPDELDDVKVLAIHAHGPGILASKKDVHSLAEIRGIKVRCTGLSAKVTEALGAIPVAMPQNEAYEALQKGVVEATLCPIEVLKGWKQGEVIDYVIETAATGYSTAMFVVMNKQKYESLPEDIQRVFDDVGEEWVEIHGKVWVEADVAGKAFVQNLGRSIHGLPPDEENRWVEAIGPIIDEYEESKVKQGLPGEKAVTLIRELIDKHSERK